MRAVDPLPLPYLADGHWPGEGEQYDFLTRGGADVVVQAQDFDAGDVLDHRFQERPRRLEQMGPHLLEQVSSLLGWQRLDQMLFGGGQDALEADHEEIIDQVRADVFGSPAHVFLLEATDPLADGGFDFPLRFHGALACLPFPAQVAAEEDRRHEATEPGSPVLGSAEDQHTKRRKMLHLVFPVHSAHEQGRESNRSILAVGSQDFESMLSDDWMKGNQAESEATSAFLLCR
jgi:hypothetical protein